MSSQHIPIQTVFPEDNLKDLELNQMDSLGIAADDYKGLLVEE